MNRKLVILLLLVATFSFHISGQSQLGFRGSFSVSSLSSGDAKSRPGFNVGAILNTPLSDNWHFQPSLLFSLNGSKSSDRYNTDYSAYFYSVETPLLLSYRMGDEDISFGVDMGAYCRYGLFGGYWTDTADGGRVKPDIFDDQKRFDVGPQIGFSIIAQGLYMGCGFQYGLVKPWKDKKGNYYSYFISFGYLFNIY